MTARVFYITLALLSTLSASAQLAPPLKRVWQRQLKDQLESVAVTRERLYFGTFHEFGAIDPETGDVLFVQPIAKEHHGAHVAFYDDTLYASVGKRGLLACDPKTGDVRWSLPGSYYGVQPLVADGRVFTTLQKGFVSAVGIKEHKPLWTVDLRRPKPRTKNSSNLYGPSVLVQLDQNRVLVGTDNGEVFCLNAATGKQLWKASFKISKYDGQISDIAVGSQVIVSSQGEVAALEPGTGHILWRFAKEEDSLGKLLIGAGGDVFALGGSGTLYCLDVKTGKQRWYQRLSKASLPTSAPLVPGKGYVLVGIEDSLQAISPTGKILWNWPFPDKFFLTPFFASATDLVIAGSHEIYRFIPGQPPGLPTDPEVRRALARKLVARLDKLTGDEDRMLDSLGDEAFEVLFSLAQSQLTHYLSLKKANENYPLYEQLRDTLRALTRVMRSKHTAAMISLLKQTDNPEGNQVQDDVLGNQSPRALIFQVLDGEYHRRRRDKSSEERSDPKLVLPIFLKELQQGEVSAGFPSALDYISRSTQPDALAFLKNNLADPKANYLIRQIAFENLVRLGGASFVPDILAARDTNRTLPSLASFIHLEGLPPAPIKKDEAREPSSLGRLLAVAKNEQGRTWGLMGCNVLGNLSDRWIVRREGKHWVEPIFIGQQQSEKGIPRDWLTRFVKNPALRVDTDGDGWTDVIEQRLGTDPGRTDTDGDGLKDSQDANPLAALRPLNDVEKVVRAAFEARYRFTQGRGTVCLVALPEGAAPLEFFSWGWIVLSTKAGQKTPLRALVSQGAYRISFRLPEYDLDGAAIEPRKTKDVIVWNADRTRAKLHLVARSGGVYGTGYDIELQKFGNEWIVVRSELIWIS